jgi:hypothetical protein
VIGIFALTLSLQSAGQVFNQQTGGDRLVVVEAESAGTVFNAQSKTWTLLSTATTPAAPTGYQGSGAMACLPNSGTGNSNATGYVNGPRLDFRILFRVTGTHYVWIRGRAPDDTAATPSQPIGNNDSCHIALNGAPIATGFEMSGWDTNWEWSRNRNGGSASFNVPSVGVHTFSVYMREDGFQVDRVLITTNASYGGVTQGGTQAGPAASGQIADQTPAAASPPVVVGGSFRIDVSWAQITNADNYLLERAPGGTNTWTTVFNGPGLTFSDDPVYVTDSDFCYRVRGVDTVFGNGPVSTPSCGRAQLPPPRTAGDNDEGFIEDNCACGASAASPFWALGLPALLLLALRRR